jgi:hypothetical protein
MHLPINQLEKSMSSEHKIDIVQLKTSLKPQQMRHAAYVYCATVTFQVVPRYGLRTQTALQTVIKEYICDKSFMLTV